MKIIRLTAANFKRLRDYQCWLEITDDEGKTGIVIEDGAAKGPEVAREPGPATALALEV